MNDIRIRRALVAVYDKRGIADLARALKNEFGIEILSTGGTARFLHEAGVPVTLVEQVTGFPEMLDGRVKTLHPKVHAAILADRNNPEHMRQLAEQGIEPIDMVVVNLYPFTQAVAEHQGEDMRKEVEMIDIGGPCMLRAAAKNHDSVLAVSYPEAYESILRELRETGGFCRFSTRFEHAIQVFETTCRYDLAIYRHYSTYFAWMTRKMVERGGNQEADYSGVPAHAILAMDRLQELRYGENPHQKASLWWLTGETGLNHRSEKLESSREATLVHAELLNGEMSFNNYVDGDSALGLIKELTRAGKSLGAQTSAPHAVAFIKHTNACGCAVGDDRLDVYRRAYLGDPIAAAGGVLCMNFPVTAEIADVVMNSFGRWGKAAGAAFFKLDVWIAPAFDAEAVRLITTPNEKRKWGAQCRLLAVGPMDGAPDAAEHDLKQIAGGLLAQSRDLLGLNEDKWQVATRRAPTEKEMADLRLAWLICKHTKSNAITLVRERTLLGSGAGQMSRVKSCDLALQLARENGHGPLIRGAVAAGDAFFPVPDGPQKLIDAGITAIIHPGGSNRDAETVAACDAAGVAMIITGTRHFKH